MRKLVSMLLPLVMGAFSASAAPRPLPAAPACAPWECAALKAPTANCPNFSATYYYPGGGNYPFVAANCPPSDLNSTYGSNWTVIWFGPNCYNGGYTYDVQIVGAPNTTLTPMDYPCNSTYRLETNGDTFATLQVTQLNSSGVPVSDTFEYDVSFQSPY